MKNKLFRLYLLLGLITSIATATAQQTITFDSENDYRTHSTRKKKKKKEVGKNSLTVGLISAINGYTPFYYERAILDFLSIQVGGGITYRSFGNDFGQLIWDDGRNSEFVDNSGSNISDLYDQYYHYKYRKSGLGSYFSVSPKVYFGENPMDGFYISPMIEWKMYRYSAQLANEAIDLNDPSYGNYNGLFLDTDDREIKRSTDKVKEFMNCLDISLTVGGHYQRPNRLTIGWSIGVGLRKFNAERLDVYKEYVGNNSEYFRNNVRSYDGMRPLLLMNLIIGGSF